MKRKKVDGEWKGLSSECTRSFHEGDSLKCFDENIILLRNLNIDVEQLGDCCRGYKWFNERVF